MIHPKFRDGWVSPSSLQVLSEGKAFSPKGGGGLFFRVPLAKPDGTLGLPFGALLAPRAWPAEPHPTLGAFFPRIQSGVECPQSLGR